MEPLLNYLRERGGIVHQRIQENKAPTDDQLKKFVGETVAKFHELSVKAPEKVKVKLEGPWWPYWDYEQNQPGERRLSPQQLMEIFKEIRDSLSGAPPAKAPGGKGGTGGGMDSTAGPTGGGGGGGGGYAPQPAAAAPKQAAVPKQAAAPGMRADASAFVPPGGGSPPPPAPPKPKAQPPPPTHTDGGVQVQGYRKFEDVKMTKGSMSADAACFVPGQSKGWTIDLCKTNAEAVKARRKDAPELSDAMKGLPTYQKKDWIIAAIRMNRVTVISGDTGCGKSTLIPQLVCDAINLVPDDKVVVCTQPRRIAAISLAQYVAADRRQELGDDVGYQIRFVNAFSEHTRLIYATTAIVLRKMHGEEDLESVGCLIVDEVHERDVYTDFVLLLIRQAMLKGQMEHLKIVLMSATLKAEDFAQYFLKVNGDTALKPVHVPGRMFPVEDYYFEDACEWLRWSPPAKGGGKGGKKGGKSKGKGQDDEPDPGKAYNDIKNCTHPKIRSGQNGSERVNEYSEKSLEACCLWKQCEVYVDLICELVHYFHKEMPKGDGAILIFLPGWGDIAKVFISLYKSGENYQLIALHSLMTPEQQQEAFDRPPKGMRKVVLSTNIAEASVTIDDIVYVIDCGVRKERSYDASTQVSSLDTTMVTKANAIQRRGRAGRVQEGLVVHLFPSYKFEKFAEFPTPQMLSSSMDEVVLQSKVIGGGSLKEVSEMLRGSMAAPEQVAIDDAVKLLKSMHCLTPDGDLTALGRACASIPIQPNCAKMLLLGGAFRCIKPAAVVAAFLAVKNPFQQSIGGDHNKQKKGPTGKDYFIRNFASDHIATIQAYCEWRKAVAKGQGDEFCEDLELSAETMDMAHMMVRQFVNFMVEAGYDGDDVKDDEDFGECEPVKKGSPEDALLRCAMVAGFYPNVCLLYKGNKSPYWYLDCNEEVSPFRGSANADYQMGLKDGQEWMVFSDSMKMGRFNSIMDSSLVFSNFVMLFADALMLDQKKNEVRFDKWYACMDCKDESVKELLALRAKIIPSFKDAIEGRDLALFPRELTERMISYVTRLPIELPQIEAVKASIAEEVTGANRKFLSQFIWPADAGNDEDAEGGGADMRDVDF